MNKYATIFISVFSAMCCLARANDTIPEIKQWNYSFSGNLYLLPDDVYLNPVFTADNSHLRMEARYNYEDIRTASLWGGYNFSTGSNFEFNATPMVGVVFGNTNGLAPGLLLDVYYWKLNVYSESEYLLEWTGKEGAFMYTWSELTFAPVDWGWFGIAVQRTKLFQTELDLQRGFTAGFSKGSLSFSGYIFDIDQDAPYGVFSLDLNF